MLETSVGAECWRRVLERSVVEKCCVQKGVGEDSCRKVLEKSVGEESCREVLEKSVVEKCWGAVL